MSEEQDPQAGVETFDERRPAQPAEAPLASIRIASLGRDRFDLVGVARHQQRLDDWLISGRAPAPSLRVIVPKGVRSPCR